MILGCRFFTLPMTMSKALLCLFDERRSLSLKQLPHFCTSKGFVICLFFAWVFIIQTFRWGNFVLFFCDFIDLTHRQIFFAVVWKAANHPAIWGRICALHCVQYLFVAQIRRDAFLTAACSVGSLQNLPLCQKQMTDANRHRSERYKHHGITRGDFSKPQKNAKRSWSMS